MKQKINYLEKLKHTFFILLGNTIFALGVVMFIIPNQLVSGGTTGLALFLKYRYNIPMSLFISIFNLTLFVIGWLCLGKKFALSSVLSTLYFPFILGILQKAPGLGMKVNDKLLCVIFAGVLIGIGIGIVIRMDASTGGIDIPPLILNKKLGIPVSLTLWTLDIIIIMLQATNTEKEGILYGIVLIVVYTAVLDRVLLIGKSQIMVKIISTKYEEINQAILTKLDRGSTLIHTRTGFQKEDGYMIVSVIANRELQKLNKVILSIDPHAFLVIHHVNEVKGKGFSLPKHL